MRGEHACFDALDHQAQRLAHVREDRVRDLEPDPLEVALVRHEPVLGEHARIWCLLMQTRRDSVDRQLHAQPAVVGVLLG